MSRTPLIRQGAGPDELLRIYEQLDTERRQIDRLINTANATEDQQQKRHRGIVARRSAAGDEQRLRAIPVCIEGVAGVIPGTNPEDAVIRKLMRRPTGGAL